MAKRSNKTAHVLNLISPVKTEEDLPAEEEALAAEQSPKEAEKAEPPQESDALPAPTPAAEVSRQEEAPPAPPMPEKTAAKPESMRDVLHLSDNTEQLSDLIRDNLEKALAEALTAEEPSQTAPPAPSPLLQEAEPFTIEPEPITSQDFTEDAPAEEPSLEEILAKNIAEYAFDTPEPIPEPAPEPVPEPIPEPAPEPVPEPAPEPIPEPKPELQCVNVYERIVLQLAPEYLERFQVCGCAHCRMDVIALTLTNLPAKYIVVEDAATAPLIDFYARKFHSHVMTELVKACLVVQKHPHHEAQE